MWRIEKKRHCVESSQEGSHRGSFLGNNIVLPTTVRSILSKGDETSEARTPGNKRHEDLLLRTKLRQVRPATKRKEKYTKALSKRIVYTTKKHSSLVELRLKIVSTKTTPLRTVLEKLDRLRTYPQTQTMQTGHTAESLPINKPRQAALTRLAACYSWCL